MSFLHSSYPTTHTIQAERRAQESPRRQRRQRVAEDQRLHRGRRPGHKVSVLFYTPLVLELTPHKLSAERICLRSSYHTTHTTPAERRAEQGRRPSARWTDDQRLHQRRSSRPPPVSGRFYCLFYSSSHTTHTTQAERRAEQGRRRSAG